MQILIVQRFLLVSSMPIENLYENFDEIQKLGYTVQLLTDLVDPSVWTQIWFR